MTIILGLLTNYKKEIILVLLLSVSFYLFHAWAYDKGYNEASDNFEKLQKQALNEALVKYGQKAKEALEIKTKDAENAAATKEVEIVVQTKVQTVTKYVDRIVVKNECADLANDVVGLLSESTDIVRQSTRSADSKNRTTLDETLRRTF